MQMLNTYNYFEITYTEYVSIPLKTNTLVCSADS